MNARLFIVVAITLATPGPAHAIYADTLPNGTFLLETRYLASTTSSNWNDQGDAGPLIEPIERYEPGGGFQGRIIPDATVSFDILANILLYGYTDDITAGMVVPVVLHNAVEPRLGWEPGDPSSTLGRAFSEDDFWQWAETMGQPRPGGWSGNEGTLSDLVFVVRWRFSPLLRFLDDTGVSTALLLYGALPTGTQADPEELTATGTTSWELNAQGELGLHLGTDWHGEGAWLGRLTVGADLFYEIFLPTEFVSSTGAENPLLLTRRPYVGETYVVDPGDYAGIELGAELVLYEGPEWDTWLSTRVPGGRDSLPPLLTVTGRYRFTSVAGTDYQSESELWDWDQEQFWRPGYKNLLDLQLTASLLRVGAPVILYGGVRSFGLIPGKNSRAPETAYFGMKIPFAL